METTSFLGDSAMENEIAWVRGEKVQANCTTKVSKKIHFLYEY